MIDRGPSRALGAPNSRTRAHAAHLWPVFLRPRALWRFFRDRRASRGSKVLLVLAVLYALWPMDLIPDMAPVIGWLDDLGVASMVLGWVALQVNRHESKLEQIELLSSQSPPA
jgi:uncharacterized membrane protein YkvA (DUF1232 family)